VDDDRARIRTFLERFSDDDEWLDGSALLTGGVLDSMMAVQLVAFLEGTFGITVEDEDLELANFDSVDGMVGLLARKRAA